MHTNVRRNSRADLTAQATRVHRFVDFLLCCVKLLSTIGHVADPFFFLDLNSVILLNFNEKNQVTSPEIFSGGGDVTSVNPIDYPFQ